MALDGELMPNPYAVQTVRCAGPNCEAVRKEVNHWFVVSTINGRFIAEPFESWGDLDAHDHPVCGSACAQKLFEQYLSK